MEIIEKQVEKVKEVPADNYGYNYGRRDINGKANVGANQCGCPRVVTGTTPTA